MVENNYEVVETIKTKETGTQTSHNSEFTESKNEQETKNVDNSTQTDGNETSVNCNQVGSEMSSVMNTSAADSDETATGLDRSTKETKDIDKILEEKLKYFKSIRDYVVKEKKALETTLEIASSNKSNKSVIEAIYKSFCDRIDDVCKVLDDIVVHSNVTDFVATICNNMQMLWKEAAIDIK